MEENKIMKVFVLLLAECVDGDDTTHLFVYSSKEKAKKHFNEAVKEAREYAEKHGWEFEEDEEEFHSYPDGSYMENHSHGSLSEKQIL